MRELVRDRVIAIDAERALNITESYARNLQVPPDIKRPLATYDVCSRMTCRVEDFELIVGNFGTSFLGSAVWPEEGFEWFYEEFDRGDLWLRDDQGVYHRNDMGTRLSITEEEKDKLYSIRDFWKGKTVSAQMDSWYPDGFDEWCALGASSYFPGKPIGDLPSGHLTAGYPKIINTGYAAIRKQAQGWVDAHRGDLMGADVEKYLFYKAAVLACDAATVMIRGYAEACRRKAAESPDPARAAELGRMAVGLDWIAEKPARTFWEAVQAAIMYQLLLYMDDRYPALAFGRFDQYTWPFLEADVETGRITMAEAQEIVDAFLLKANCFYRAAPPFLNEIVGVGNTYQHTTIGGVDPETGADASNPVTHMVLESMGRLLLHDPTISIRIHENTPDELWGRAIEMTKLVGGLPLFQNDEVIIPALVESGFSLRDARDYSLIGCQEIVGSGNDYPAPNGTMCKATVHYGTILVTALNNGVNPMNGRSGALRTGHLYEMQSFEEVKAALKAQVEYFLRWLVTMNNYSEHIAMTVSPHAALSISIEGCMESGKDCVRGGAKYNSFGGTATGLATVADSLTAIRYMVFDKGLCTAQELYDAYMADWRGYEPLRQRILNEVPHFGNNDPYADEQMAWICGLYHDTCRQMYSTRSSTYKSGLYGAADHVAQGALTWATPDGRRAGEPLADAASPAQGRDLLGPTGVFGSEVCFDHRHFLDGIAVNLKIHPSALRGGEGAAKLRDVTKAYFDEGGMEVQYNVVSADDMRAAQKDPAAHRNLVVRIAGYSAYFVELSPRMQNDIISRTENVL
jgi:pyruvate formate-lyase/glycerol dehydratase family glycyl radical enzyme